MNLQEDSSHRRTNLVPIPPVLGCPSDFRLAQELLHKLYVWPQEDQTNLKALSDCAVRTNLEGNVLCASCANKNGLVRGLANACCKL